MGPRCPSNGQRRGFPKLERLVRRPRHNLQRRRFNNVRKRISKMASGSSMPFFRRQIRPQIFYQPGHHPKCPRILPRAGLAERDGQIAVLVAVQWTERSPRTETHATLCLRTLWFWHNLARGSRSGDNGRPVCAHGDFDRHCRVKFARGKPIQPVGAAAARLTP